MSKSRLQVGAHRCRLPGSPAIAELEQAATVAIATESGEAVRTAATARDAALRLVDEERRRTENILERLTAGFVAFDDQWHIIYLNSYMEQILGRSREELLDTNPWQVNPAATTSPFYQAYVAAMETQKPGRVVAYYPPLDKWLDAHLYPSPDGLSVYMEDVTEQRRTEAERDRFFALSLDLLCIADTRAYFLRVNPAFEQVLGYRESELLEQPFIDFVHPDDRNATLAELANLNAGTSTIRFQNRYRCKDGTYRWLEWNSAPFTEDGVCYAVAHDITEQKLYEDKLEHLASHDSLTGLPNRSLFTDRLDHALRGAARRQRQVGVLYIDVDHFKEINDTFGHDTGDTVLIGVGQRLLASLRKNDTLARRGGEEFTALLEALADASEVTVVAERIRASFQAPFQVAGQTDVALYQAKTTGRNRYVIFAGNDPPSARFDAQAS